MPSWGILLIMFGLLQLVCSIFISSLIAVDGYGYALTPKAIKSLNNFTWFGTIFIFIFLILTIPYVYLFALLYLLFKGHFPEGFE